MLFLFFCFLFSVDNHFFTLKLIFKIFTPVFLNDMFLLLLIIKLSCSSDLFFLFPSAIWWNIIQPWKGAKDHNACCMGEPWKHPSGRNQLHKSTCCIIPCMGQKNVNELFARPNILMVKDREAWHASVHGVEKTRTWLSNWKTTTNTLNVQNGKIHTDKVD